MTTKRRQSSVWIDGSPLQYQASPFMERQFSDLAKHYDTPSSIIHQALYMWTGALELSGEQSDMKALQEYTGLRPQEIIELAMYDLWRRWKGL